MPTNHKHGTWQRLVQTRKRATKSLWLKDLKGKPLELKNNVNARRENTNKIPKGCARIC